MQNAEQLSSVIAAWGPTVRSALKIGFALRTESDIQLIYSMTVLSNLSPENTVPLNIQTKSILAYRSVVEIASSEREKVVQTCFANPELFETPHWEATLRRPGEPFGRVRTTVDLIRLSRLGLGVERFPGVTCRADRHRFNATLDQLNLELMTHNTPFDGLNDLISELALPIQADQLLHTATAATTEMLIAPPIELAAPWDLSSGKLKLKFFAREPLDAKNVEVGVRLYPVSGPAARKSLKVEQLSWAPENATLAASAEFEVPDAPLARVFLRYAGEHAGTWWFRDPANSFNNNYQILRTTDPKDIFRSRFLDGSNDFDDRVNLLLNLIGVPTLKTGEIASIRSESPDIIAWSRDGLHLYAIECTTGDIDNKGKLHRLYERTNVIAQNAKKLPNPPVSVQAIMVTSLARAETELHWGKAQNWKIAIVARENLENLLSRLESPPSPKDLHDAVLELVPSTEAPTTTSH